MSSIGATNRQLLRMMNDVTDDGNIISLRYKYCLTRNQRFREIFKEILNGKPT